MTVERRTVHIADDTGRTAMYEKRTVGTGTSDGGTAAELIRYIYSNHLQSTSLELDDTGAIISYEEYHPFGTTSYQAMNASINAVAKRYRYTGKERDDESGLYYHGARYYIPWLCRWSAVDPLESKYAGMSGYNYCEGNPVIYHDPDGQGKKPEHKKVEQKKPEQNKSGPAAKVGYVYNPPGNSPAVPNAKITLPTSSPTTDGTQAAVVRGMKQAPKKTAALKRQQDIKNYNEMPVMGLDFYGNFISGKRIDVESNISNQQQEYKNRLGEAIASGPVASGMYLAKGDRGAFQGEAIQNIAMSFSGVSTPYGVTEPYIRITRVSATKAPMTIEPPTRNVVKTPPINLWEAQAQMYNNTNSVSVPNFRSIQK